jgi:hypothetical protein
MGGLASRQKGRRGEREVIAMLQPIVDSVYKALDRKPVVLQRNTLQSHLGGFDVVGLNWLAVEVKHAEAPSLGAWWKQCTDQAQGREPVLFYRSNFQPWRIRLWTRLETMKDSHWFVADVSVDCFLPYFESRVRDELIRAN